MPRFDPHGDIGLEVWGQVLILHPRKSINVEEMQRRLATIDQLLPQFGEHPWAAMLVFESVVLLTPDAETLARDAHLRLAARGQKALAMVMPDTPTRSLVAALVRRIHAGAPYPVKVFDHEADALDWLTKIIGTPPPARPPAGRQRQTAGALPPPRRRSALPDSSDPSLT